MGCGAIARGPENPLYTNEFSPPSHELVPIDVTFPESFPPSGMIKLENGTFFNDREFIKQCQIIHIHEVSVFVEKYITGIEILYYLDGNMKEGKHCGTVNGKKQSMPVQNSDSIFSCDITYQQNKIHSIRFETIEGRLLDAVCTSGYGKEKVSLNLKQERRAIVAFKGKYEEYLDGLSCYSWKMCIKLRK